MLKDKTNKTLAKKKQMNPSKCPKPGLISQICNSLNSRLGLNQETQFNIEWWNWKKINLKNLPK